MQHCCGTLIPKVRIIVIHSDAPTDVRPIPPNGVGHPRRPGIVFRNDSGTAHGTVNGTFQRFRRLEFS